MGFHIDKNLALSLLQDTLYVIEKVDPSSFTFEFEDDDKNDKQYYYDMRNNRIYDAVYYARLAGLKAGFCIHTPVTDIIEKGWDYRWGVVAYIELPTGQVSWHIESPDIQYDGHNYQDKHDRIVEFKEIYFKQFIDIFKK